MKKLSFNAYFKIEINYRLPQKQKDCNYRALVKKLPQEKTYVQHIMTE